MRTHHSPRRGQNYRRRHVYCFRWAAGMSQASAERYCRACESAAIAATTLGFIGDDGAFGEVAGFACRSCKAIWQATDVVPIITGRVDLRGQRAIEWFTASLRAAGCDPKQR